VSSCLTHAVVQTRPLLSAYNIPRHMPHLTMLNPVHPGVGGSTLLSALTFREVCAGLAKTAYKHRIFGDSPAKNTLNIHCIYMVQAIPMYVFHLNLRRRPLGSAGFCLFQS